MQGLFGLQWNADRQLDASADQLLQRPCQLYVQPSRFACIWIRGADGWCGANSGPSGGNRAGGSGGGRGGSPLAGGPGGVRGGFGPGNTSSGHRYTFTLGAQAFNLFNVVPLGTPTSTLTSSRFGQYTTLAAGPFSSSTAVRRITLQASFNF